MVYLNERVGITKGIYNIRGSDVSTSGTISDLASDGVTFFRLTAATTLNSIAAPTGNFTSGKELIIVNANSVNLTIKNENSGSTAANRITTGLNRDFLLAPGASACFIYNDGASRWVTTNGNMVIGRVDGVGPSAGYVGELSVTSNSAASVTINGNSTSDVTSISITPGYYQVCATVFFSAIGASINRVAVFFSTTSAASASVANLIAGGGSGGTTNANDLIVSTRMVYVNYSATTTLYLVAGGFGSTNTSTVGGYEINLLRIAG